MTYSKVVIISRNRKTKTYCVSGKIKAAADKNIYKGSDGYLPSRSPGTHPQNAKK